MRWALLALLGLALAQGFDPINRSDAGLGGNRVLVVSFRLGGEDLPRFHRPLSPAEEARILRAVLGPRVPASATVVGSSQGRYTASSREETVYLVVPEGPAALDPQNGREAFFALFEGGRLRQKIPAPYTTLLWSIPSLSAFFPSALLVGGAFYNMGTLSLSARLVTLQGGRLWEAYDFGVVYLEACDANPKGEVEAKVLLADRVGKGFKASSERYRAPCQAKDRLKAFRRVSP